MSRLAKRIVYLTLERLEKPPVSTKAATTVIREPSVPAYTDEAGRKEMPPPPKKVSDQSLSLTMAGADDLC